MKKILLLVIICLGAFLLFACGDDNNNNNNTQTPNNTNVSAPVVNNTPVAPEKVRDQFADGPLDYKDTDFTDVAGYAVEKSDKLSNITYDTIFLLDESTSQLDLKFGDGRIATLLVKKTEQYVNEEDANNLKIGDYEVKKMVGIDGIVSYYWNKEDASYHLSHRGSDTFSEEDILNVIEGFSIKPGENY